MVKAALYVLTADIPVVHKELNMTKTPDFFNQVFFFTTLLIKRSVIDFNHTLFYIIFILFYASYFLNKIEALCPPKPKEFVKAYFTSAFCALCGT